MDGWMDGCHNISIICPLIIITVMSDVCFEEVKRSYIVR